MKKLFAAAVLITVLILGACPVCRSEDDRDLDRKVREIVSGAIQPGMSDYDKALALHDWLCSHAEYDYSLKNYDAEDILFDGTGVCQAYTEAYGLLLDAAGIPNAKASGTAGGGSHTWNMAKLGGRWYHIDCTWDDGAYRIGHIWFCLSDYAVSFDHTASSKPYAALSYELNYYYRNTAYICPQCHEIFKPSFREMFWASHTPKTRKLTCVKCGHKGFCVETWGGDAK